MWVCLAGKAKFRKQILHSGYSLRSSDDSSPYGERRRGGLPRCGASATVPTGGKQLLSKCGGLVSSAVWEHFLPVRALLVCSCFDP